MKSTFLAVIFLSLQYILWVGENSIWKVLTLNQCVALQQEKNCQLLAKNLQLKYEISLLKKDPIKDSPLIEDYVRWKLGLVKNREWFCQW